MVRFATISIFTLLLFFTADAVSQDYAITQLESSPRHHEWVDVTYGDRTVKCFVVYPEVSDKATAVVVIHENRGLNDWARSFTDQLAAEGYVTIAPDLLSGYSDEFQQTSDFPTSDEARKALYNLEPEQVLSDIKAVRDFASTIEAANGKTAIAGFCWGGSQTFRSAISIPEFKAAFVFYGTAPKDKEAFENIEMPVYGFYGENDQRVNATIESTEARMKELGKAYEYVIYPEAGHAFMRRGDDPNADEAHQLARNQAMARLSNLLSEL
jgi:carboxymethylenebutenolidase